jgi:DNA-binding NarL/FixJ family response regulator
MILHSRFPSADISEASNGEETLKTVSSNPPDLIFLDIRLPGSNGLDLAIEIKSLSPQIVIAIFTTHDFLEYREKAFQCGAQYFMSKHLTNAEDLVAVVSDVISRM